MTPVRHWPKGVVVATDNFKYVKLGGDIRPNRWCGNRK
jgi:hypothetical protein